MKQGLEAAKKIVASFLAVAICSGVGSAAEPSPAAKKDITDPVMQEIISNIGPRMPRFVDKHGKNIFVVDEPVTRGSLLMALYEYDKSLKMPKKDFASKQELDELKDQVSQLTRSGVKPGNGAEKAVKIDIMQVINELQPNMPYLLDNSLNNSKVFNSLRSEMGKSHSTGSSEATYASVQNSPEMREFARRLDKLEKNSSSSSSASDDTVRQELSLTHQELLKLSKRMNEIEMKGPSNYTPGASSSQDITAVNDKIMRLSRRLEDVERQEVTKDELSLTQQDLNKLSRRINDVEKRSGQIASSGSSSNKEIDDLNRKLARLSQRVDEVETSAGTPSSGGDARAYTSMLTKVSLGLSMVAALFIAR